MLFFIEKISIAHLIVFSILIKAALFLYAYYSNDLSIFYRPDTPAYIASIEGLLTTGVFGINGEYETLRTPGYPIFLSLGYVLGNVEVVSILLQICISTVTLFYVYKLSLFIDNKNNKEIAKIACLLYLLEPMSLIFASTLLLSETLLTMLTMLGLYYFISFIKRNNIRTLIASTVFFIFALYVKPIVFFLPFILTVYMLIRGLSYKYIAIFLIPFLIAFSSWSYRNYVVSGSFQFSTVSKVNISLNALSVLYYKHVDDSNIWSIPVTQLRREGLSFLSSSMRDKKNNNKVLKDIALYKDGSYFRIFTDNFYISSGVYLTGLFKIISGTGASDYFSVFRIDFNNKSLYESGHKSKFNQLIRTVFNNPIPIIINTLLLLQLILVYIFFIKGVRRFSDYEVKILLLLVIFYFVLISSGVFGYSRFRMPIMPFIEMISGYGLYYYIKR